MRSCVEKGRHVLVEPRFEPEPDAVDLGPLDVGRFAKVGRHRGSRTGALRWPRRVSGDRRGGAGRREAGPRDLPARRREPTR
ncbi:MAG: hypothetical protein ACK55I_21675, partial [bacterium]